MRTETYEVATQWVEPFVPKGCMRERARVFHESLPVSLDAFDDEEAPVAFDTKGWNPFGTDIEIRLCEGALYVKKSDRPAEYIERTFAPNRKNYRAFEGGDKYYQKESVYSREQVETALERVSDGKAVIDGRLYERLTEEPGYRVEYLLMKPGGRGKMIVPTMGDAEYGFDQLEEALADNPGAEVPYEVEVLAPGACSDVVAKRLEAKLRDVEGKAEALFAEYNDLLRAAAELKMRIHARRG